MQKVQQQRCQRWHSCVRGPPWADMQDGTLSVQSVRPTNINSFRPSTTIYFKMPGAGPAALFESSRKAQEIQSRPRNVPPGPDPSFGSTKKTSLNTSLSCVKIPAFSYVKAM